MTTEKPQLPPFFAVLIFASLIAVGGGWFWLITWRSWTVVREAKSWDTTTCEIVASSVKSETQEDSNGNVNVMYSPLIRYQYDHDGREYRGDQYTVIGGSSRNPESWTEIIERYPVGSEHHCFVNPNDPSEAVLECELPMLVILAGMIGLPFIVIGIGGIVYWIRPKKRALAVNDDADSFE